VTGNPAGNVAPQRRPSESPESHGANGLGVRLPRGILGD
jgi:hypothetical protein